ncbi:hypothetical protein F511_03555 [Dorcoceras hygrometricum]|uniref:Uncharacterized protein n=1 Tax=Dorcoceras hygrometricum TaxID=472368 RepID=A0A2Z7BQF4_9LAMI|nr:hypothetical protein F511_03555 [Dorcoceras hygrometricum]
MEHNGMIEMFKSLEETGLKGFLEASDSIFEEDVVEFFINSKVIAGTIVSLVGTRKIAIAGICLMLRIFAPIRFHELDWATPFLPQIAPMDKGNKMMDVVARLHPVEEHCKLLEIEKVYNVHLANFKLDVPSVNHDYLCIRRLYKELTEIAALHRDQRVLTGLMTPEASSVELVSNHTQVLALEFSSQAEKEQAADPTSIQSIEQHDSEVVKYPEHQAHEIEPPENGHQALDDESNTELQFLLSETRTTGPRAFTKLDEVEKAVASIDSRMIYMESKLTSVDSRMLSIDSKMHSMEFKVRSMGSHIEQLLDTQTFLKLDFGLHKGVINDKVDTLTRTVKTSQTALETSIIHQLAGQQRQFTDDLDLVKSQLVALLEHFKHIGNDKKGEGTK